MRGGDIEISTVDDEIRNDEKGSILMLYACEAGRRASAVSSVTDQFFSQLVRRADKQSRQVIIPDALTNDFEIGNNGELTTKTIKKLKLTLTPEAFIILRPESANTLNLRAQNEAKDHKIAELEARVAMMNEQLTLDHTGEDHENELPELQVKGLKLAGGDCVYTGGLLRGKRHGYGQTLFPSGANYEGNYVDNKRHGQGTYKFPDGAIYEGGWIEGKKHGQGKYTFANGNFYDGSWKEDKRDGQGTSFKAANNETRTGIWSNDHNIGWF